MGCIVGGIGVSLLEAFPAATAAIQGNFAVVCFGISAATLIFAQTGFAVPATHQITLPAAFATVMSGNVLVGIIVAVLCSLFGNIVGRVFNNHTDTFIDPPAVTIFTSMFILLAIF